MSSGKRSSHSRGAGTRNTIHVRNPAAGVVYHLSFEGNLRRLTGRALSRHLAAVAGIPPEAHALLTEEGHRVRSEDNGDTLGLGDGSTLTLQLLERFHHHRPRDRDVEGDAWRRHGPQLPPYAESDNRDFGDGPIEAPPPPPHDSPRVGQQQQQWFQPYPQGSAVRSPPGESGYTKTYSDWEDNGVRRDSSYAEDVEDLSASASSMRVSPYNGGDGTSATPTAPPPGVSGPPGQPHPSPRPLLPPFPASPSAGSSTVPSPAEERDVRDDFSPLSATPRYSGYPPHYENSSADGVVHRGPVAADHHHHHHHGRRREKPRHEYATDAGEGALVTLPPAPPQAPSSLTAAVRAPLTSALAGVTPEEQALMDADELAELLHEREHVWQMEQQRFHTEREYHARELQRREKELLFEAQLLAAQQAELARETERERHRLAAVQSARALSPAAPRGMMGDPVWNGFAGHDEGTASQHNRVKGAPHAVNGDGDNGGRGSQRVGESLARRPPHPSQVRGGSASSVATSVSARASPPTPWERPGTSSPTASAKQPWPTELARSKIQVLGTSFPDGRRGMAPLPSFPTHDNDGARPDTSPLPRPYQQRHPPQPMSLLYSNTEERSDAPGNGAAGRSAPCPPSVARTTHGVPWMDGAPYSR